FQHRLDLALDLLLARGTGLFIADACPARLVLAGKDAVAPAGRIDGIEQIGDARDLILTGATEIAGFLRRLARHVEAAPVLAHQTAEARDEDVGEAERAQFAAVVGNPAIGSDELHDVEMLLP